MALSQQVLMGKAGGHFFLMDPENKNGLRLSVFDTATQVTTSRNYAFPRPLSVLMNDNSAVFISATINKTNADFHLLELDGAGYTLRKKEGPLVMQKAPVRIIASANKKYILFYQYNKRAADSSLIIGSLFGTDWNIKKQLQYGFKYDSELDAEPEIFLDNEGNTHVLVTDKFTNYRISSDLTVNTIPFAEEQIVSETFTFEKVKLKSLHVFQNTSCDCMQAEGLYVDGTGKTNRGIYSLAFPPGRKNALAPRFIPFNDEMIKNLRRGFSATNEVIQKSIELQEIFYDDNGSIAVLRLNAGVPQKSLKIRPEDDPSLKSFNNTLKVSRTAEMQLPPANTATVIPRLSTGQPQPARTIGQADKYVNAAPLIGVLPIRQSPLSSRASARNAPKLIFVKLQKEQGVQWYESRSLDIFTPENDIYNRAFIINGEKEGIPILLYQADAADEPYPVLVTIQPSKQNVERLPEKKLMLSRVQFLGHHEYASLYLNTETGESGLLVILNKE